MPKTDDVLLKRAKAMRSAMTPPERLLWTMLRAKRFEGIKFSRQVVIAPFIVDFAARSAGLIIEVDGDTHTDQARDDRRTAWLHEQGYRVIRFTNADVVTNMEGVLRVIGDALAAAPLPNPLPRGERV